jgi:transposase
MTKYSEEFKLSVVKEYLEGRDGYREICRQRGIGHGDLREWVGAYKAHGIEGLKKKFSHYNADFKLLVLKHMLDNKLSHRETMAAFNLRSRAGLRDWEKRYRSGGMSALEPRRKGRPKSMPDRTSKPPVPPDGEQQTREELLAELNCLRMENAYLKKLKALVQSKQALTKRK